MLVILGFGIGLVHYSNFANQADCNCYTTDNYFKVRTQISYNKTKLEHFDKFANPERTSLNSQRLRQHEVEANNFYVWMQLE